MSQDKKRESIIEAAQKRFLHFGVDKTTMNEIADDLSISKASLYYYFPDKLSLYAAVLKKIIEAEQAIETALTSEKNVLKAINKFLEARTESIIKNYNLLEYLRTIGTDVPSELQAIFNAARSRELNVTMKIIANAAASKSLIIKDPQKIAELLIDCLEGLRLATFSRKANFFPDKDQFYELLKREKEFVGIFVKGLNA
ncbi:MAG TPA: TetR/AcrR family transcriptional regulator [Segetibacter sp.]|nr:TetR/AcrR family transcriptional regulator [Segetibacter sp.]